MKGQLFATVGDTLRAKKLIASGCVFFTTPQGEPYRSNRQACGGKVVAEGQHGWLCQEHRKMLEAHLESQRKQAVAHIPNQGYTDDDIVNSIITIEKRAISRGVVRRVSFGSFAFQPDFIHYWEAR